MWQYKYIKIFDTANKKIAKFGGGIFGIQSWKQIYIVIMYKTSFLWKNFYFLNYDSLETQDDYEFYNGANNTQDGVYFKVTSPKKNYDKNIIIIRFASSEKIIFLKSDLIKNGFIHDGVRTFNNDEDVELYKTKSIGVFISQRKNTNGYYQVDVFPIIAE